MRRVSRVPVIVSAINRRLVWRLRAPAAAARDIPAFAGGWVRCVVMVLMAAGTAAEAQDLSNRSVHRQRHRHRWSRLRRHQRSSNRW
jgi:hypothetical protein